MRGIVTRLDRLERQRGNQDVWRARVEADAAAVWMKIEALAIAMDQRGRMPELEACGNG